MNKVQSELKKKEDELQRAQEKLSVRGQEQVKTDAQSKPQSSHDQQAVEHLQKHYLAELEAKIIVIADLRRQLESAQMQLQAAQNQDQSSKSALGFP